MLEKKVIFWDVDTQFDFMNPQGKLFVPGADKIIDNVSNVRKFALENGYSIIASTDWHSLDNDEISPAPDYKTTFPPHCIVDTSGAQRVGFLGDIPINYIGTEEMPRDRLAELVDRPQFHIVLRKNTLDIFENPNTDEILRLVNPQTVIVYGIALDFCVGMIVCDLLRRGKADVIVLEDAAAGLGTRPNEEIFEEFRTKGVKVQKLDDLKYLSK
jgi:nicotinamidase/pyrazinamidase